MDWLGPRNLRYITAISFLAFLFAFCMPDHIPEIITQNAGFLKDPRKIYPFQQKDQEGSSPARQKTFKQQHPIPAKELRKNMKPYPYQQRLVGSLHYLPSPDYNRLLNFPPCYHHGWDQRKTKVTDFQTPLWSDLYPGRTVETPCRNQAQRSLSSAVLMSVEAQQRVRTYTNAPQ